MFCARPAAMWVCFVSRQRRKRIVIPLRIRPQRYKTEQKRKHKKEEKKIESGTNANWCQRFGALLSLHEWKIFLVHTKRVVKIVCSNRRWFEQNHSVSAGNVIGVHTQALYKHDSSMQLKQQYSEASQQSMKSASSVYKCVFLSLAAWSCRCGENTFPIYFIIDWI